MKNNFVKKLVFPLILLFIVAQGRAQVGDAGDFHFMPKVGFSLSTIMGLSNTMRSGLNAGVGCEYQFTDRISVEGGAYYSMQGASQKYRIQGEYVDTYLNNDYINIPIYAKVYLYKGFNVFGGPQLGIEVNTNFSIEGAHSKVYKTEKVYDMFYPIDFALCVGGGYQFENGLFFSVNYNFGLLDALKQKSLKIEGDKTELEIMKDDEVARNGVLQANLGWRF